MKNRNLICAAVLLELLAPGVVAASSVRSAPSVAAPLRGPALSVVGTSLAELQEAGSVILPPGEFMGLKTEALFTRAWRENLIPQSGKDRTLVLFRRNEDTGVAAWGTNSAKIRRFLDGLTTKLQEALPGEDFHLQFAGIQVTQDKRPRAHEPHIDRTYSYHLAASYPLSLRSRGPLLYRVDKDVTMFETVPTGPRSAAIVSAVGREYATGKPGTLHAAWPHRVRRRVVLLVGWVSDDMPPMAADLPSRFLDTLRERERRLKVLLGL
jgi:hypothetical protein